MRGKQTNVGRVCRIVLASSRACQLCEMHLIIVPTSDESRKK